MTSSPVPESGRAPLVQLSGVSKSYGGVTAVSGVDLEIARGEFVSHSAKASGRAVVNASPEPFSNVIVSGLEDVLTIGGLTLTLVDPVLAGIVAVSLLAVTLLLLYASWRILKRIDVVLRKL